MRRGIAYMLLSLLAVSLLGFVVRPAQSEEACCDRLVYRSMSYNLFNVTRPELNVPPPSLTPPAWVSPENGLNRYPPYVYRVLTPLLARMIAYATGIDSAYYVVTFLSLAATATFVALTVFTLTRSDVPALASSALVVLNPYTARLFLWNYMLVDPLSLALTSVAIWAVVGRRRWVFFVVCAIGVLNKETMVPMLAVYPLSERLLAGRVTFGSLTAAGLILGEWIALRLAIPVPVNRYSMLGEFRGLGWVPRMIAGVLVVFGPVAAAAVRRSLRSRVVLSLTPFVAACVLETWFIDNIARVMVQAIPAVSVATFCYWPSDSDLRRLALAPFALAAGFSAVYAFSPRTTVLTELVALAAVVTFVGVVFELRLHRLETATIGSWANRRASYQ